MRETPLILVAEDNPTLRSMLRLVLTRSGYEVVEAADGIEAADQAAQRRPDLLLLDIRMPRMDGLEALRKIRAMAGLESVPAVMLTALANRKDVVEAAHCGAADYIVKSNFDMGAFLIKVQQLLLAASGLRGGASAPGPARRPVAADLRDAAGMAELVSRRPTLTHGNVLEQVGRITGARTLPFVLPRVLALTASQYSSAEQLVSAVEKDPALTGKVLAMANSSLYRRERAEVTNLSAAVRNIGFGSVRQGAMGLGLVDLFNAAGPADTIDRVRFWEHSIAAAVVAQSLAARGGLDESLAFTTGLLHNLGRLIQDDFFHDDLAGLLAFYDADRPLPPDLERRWMGLEHPQLAKAVMEAWRIPAEIVGPIADLRAGAATLADRNERRRRLAGLVQAADQLATCFGFGDPRALQLWHVADELIDDFGIDDEVLRHTRDSLPGLVMEMKLVMLVYMPSLKLAESAVPVSDRPLLYLRTRRASLDVFELFLRLRHRTFRAFTDVRAFLQSVEDSQGSSATAVVNLLPSAPVERAFDVLDEWAERCEGASSVRGLALARADQLDRLAGPWGRCFAGMAAPVSAAQLTRFLGLEAAGRPTRDPRPASRTVG